MCSLIFSIRINGVVVYNKTKINKGNRVINRLGKSGGSLFGIFLAFLLSIPTPASADTDRFLNLGLEGGLSIPNSDSSFGGHISVRSSLVKVYWRGGRDKITPKKWMGGYARAELNPQGYRAVLGYGHSAFFTQTGLEYGLFVASGQEAGFGYGAEMSLYTTTGLAALYIRESVVMHETPQWQTDVGVRVQFPLRID